ncbi:MAG: cell surface protein SprA [Bacteroidota bacterium]
MKKRNLLLLWRRHSQQRTKRRLSIGLLLPLVALLTYKTLANRTAPPSPYSYETLVGIAQDTIPLEDRYDDYINNPSTNPFDLADPSIIQKDVEYDPETNQYIITERIGDDYFRMPTYMSFDEYLEYKQQQQQESYFQKISSTAQNNKVRRGDQLANMLNIDPNNPLGEIDIEKNLADRLFGGSEVSIRPQGSIDLTFGLERSVIENPVLTERQQRPPPQFLFNMVPQIDVQGSIGEKLNLNMNYNSQATFDFDRQIMKLEYKSDAFSEDDIIKTIEAGNVTLPLNGTLIQGAQSLFGLKTQLQFGKFYITGIASQQKSEREEIQIKGGSQLQEYEVFADEYDENRHFLLSYFNRETFNENLSNLPQILSLFTIEQIDVWVTNDRNVTAREGEPGPRDIIALSDLGEANVLTNPERVRLTPGASRGITTGVLNQDFILPDNNANNLYSRIEGRDDVRQIDRAVAVLQNQFGLQQSKDFEKVSARRLREGTEFTVNRELGFVSLNVNLQQDQVLGVAFQYSYNGQTYKVGELYNDAPATGVSADTAEIAQEVLFVKMLKSTTPRVDIPLWDLMMKNFYNIGAYQVDRKDFKLDVFYEDTGVNSDQRASDPGRGRKRFLPATNLEGVPLIRVFNLDELNVQGDPGRNGVFDYVPGLTIYPRTGRVMFPVLEPFGDHLEEQITTGDEGLFVYPQLYDSTVIFAREFPELNRFSLRGEYRSAISNEISLGAFNIPPGSVTVRAGGQILREGVDYEIDYNIGRIRILNDAYLSSGIPVNVSFENNALFGFQTKTMVGLRADYKFNENFVLGGTFLQLLERPFTPKVNIGDDPINNKIYGLDLNYSAEAPWLTRLVDKIPLIDTKAPSSVTLMAEAAALRPGHPRAINENGGEDKGGILYLDDFEGSASGIDLRQPANAWVIASVPQGTGDAGLNFFPEADLINDTRSGANRALLNWYRIDPIVRGGRGFGNTFGDDPNPYTANIPINEVFPNRTVLPGELTNIFTFDLNFEPTKRGPYNFDVPGGYPGISQGMTSSGNLEDPESRWGGIMRAININNFEQANVQFIEFWMMSPFLDVPDGNGGFIPGNTTGGDVYLDLGNISEDILRDSRKFFENGLPSPNNPDRRTTQTEWANVPLTQQVTNAFDIDPAARAAQDVGLDGLENQGEREKYADYLSRLGGINGGVRQQILEDPANDDFVHYLDERFSDGTPILERYDRFNNQEGNSQASQQGQGGLRSATNIPDAEDLDQDNTLNESEAYFQYRIPLRPAGGGRIAANRYITDERVVNVGDNQQRIWYRMRIPVDDIQRKSIGGIQDLRSVRFIRMYMRDFEEQATLRFARMELVRQQWRVYQQDLAQDSLVNPDFPTAFNLNAVNIEENSNRCPFPYDLPPGIQRENNIGVFQGFQNEQSISLEARNLADGDARGVYKTLNIDLRNYERLKMFVHAENVGYAECNDAEDDVFCDPDLEDGDVTAFIRLGSDFVNNYYEYEIPLTLTKFDPDSLTIEDIPTNGQASTPKYLEQLWKESNEFDIDLAWLKDAKIERNQSDIRLSEEYTEFTPQGLKNGHVIKIRGNPNLGYVKTVMIGIRNPKSPDRQDHCIEIWANELRLQGLNEQGGVAGLARLDMQLADFGSVSASANFSSIGFGALDQQLDERQLDQVAGFDVSTNLELSRFLPADWGVRLPAYAAYSRTTTRPKFDPYDLDIPLSENLALADSQEERQEIRERAQEVNTIKTVSMNNVGKERTSNAPPLPWDVSNFSASYAYTEAETTDPLIEYDRNENHQATLDYNYALPLRPIEPFKNLPDKDYLKVLRDLNFSPLPNSFAFSTTMYREVAETRYRFTDLDPVFSTFYNKQFTWDRTYDVQWDFSRALKMNFSAQNFAVIDEPNETAIREGDPTLTDDQVQRIIRDSILTNIGNLGRPKNYGHNLNVNFTLPTRSIPFLDWITARAQYSADYNWGAAALNVEDLGLGNIISNGNRRQATADLSFDKLYDKWGYLKQINRPAGRRGRSSRSTTRSRRPTSRSKEGDEKEKEQREVSKIERALIRPLLMVRKARASYSEDLGTLIPGFTPTSSILGLSPGFDAPGWDFIAGFQPNIRTLEQEQYGTSADWLHQISNARGADSWITNSVLLNQKVAQQYSRTMDAQLTLEPFTDFRIDVEARSNFTENHTQTFKDTLADGVSSWIHAQPVNVGSMTVTYFALNTFFNGLEVSDLSELFQLYEENRLVASEILGSGVHRDPVLAGEGYTEGYGRVQPDVLIPSFLAAYRGKSINDVGVERNYVRNNLFSQLPIPNWRMTYTGLSKIPMFKEVFQSVNISHGYQSQMQINSFNTDLDFLQNGNGGINKITGNFFSRLEIPELVIQEAFAPLIGVDVRTANGISLRANVNRSRTLAMSFVSNQLAETQSQEYQFGFGWLMSDVNIGFLRNMVNNNPKRKKKKPTTDDQGPLNFPGAGRGGGGSGANVGDLDININFSYRDDVTLNHLLDQNILEPTRGTTQISFSPAAEYQMHERLALRVFFDYARTVPRVSTGFPVSNSAGGVVVRFTLNE